jgi:hypothetical protein
LLILRRSLSGKLSLRCHGVGSLGHLKLLTHHIEVVLIGGSIAVVASLVVA